MRMYIDLFHFIQTFTTLTLKGKCSNDQEIQRLGNALQNNSVRQFVLLSTLYLFLYLYL